MKKMNYILIGAAGVLLLVLAGCAAAKSTGTTGAASSAGYTQISQEEAKQMMEVDDGHLIVDVRREDEYAEKHIPGAINVPNESIGTSMPKQLPDLDQVILVYCRSGSRSKAASEKLASIGYTRVYEFGGIMNWTGETVSGE